MSNIRIVFNRWIKILNHSNVSLSKNLWTGLILWSSPLLENDHNKQSKVCSFGSAFNDCELQCNCHGFSLYQAFHYHPEEASHQYSITQHLGIKVITQSNIVLIFRG